MASDAAIVTWGSGEDGQLGIGNNEEKEWVPNVTNLLGLTNLLGTFGTAPRGGYANQASISPGMMGSYGNQGAMQGGYPNPQIGQGGSGRGQHGVGQSGGAPYLGH
ncbi:unnamed protein product [Prunus armeniaca]|uniref:Uncharacterized protein n=1 Tax=Prunus armeniaca TaxID=36596 RepID=A0A6J5UPS8_PRUAR|nr:unnamed protein product [Prunus armeniaca]